MSERLIKNIKQKYYKLYEILSPSDSSVNLTKELWDNWEKSDFVRPNVDGIAADAIKREELLFHEIVKIAEQIVGKSLNIEYCPFVLYEYNFSAISADDGY